MDLVDVGISSPRLNSGMVQTDSNLSPVQIAVLRNRELMNGSLKNSIINTLRMNKRFEKSMLRQELEFLDHTYERVSADESSRLAIQSLSNKFGLINTIQQSMSV